MKNFITRGSSWGQVACVLLCLVLPLSAHAVLIKQWERKAIKISLPVGKERTITLNRNVRLGLPKSLANTHVLRVQSVGGVLYLKASKAFPVERVQAQDLETGELFLFDFSASAKGGTEPIQIVYPNAGRSNGQLLDSINTINKSGGRKSNSPAVVKRANEEVEQPTETVSGFSVAVELTRYAAQSIYAPKRTLEQTKGIHRVPMRGSRSLKRLVPSLPFSAKPMGAWKKGDLTVTAVRLVNQDKQRDFQLDPRWLQGDFYSATFMHNSIGRHGSVEDSTTVFIVTQGTTLANALLK